MKFRDAEQRARVCRALLTTTMDRARADTLWTRRGPTDFAIELAEENHRAEVLQEHARAFRLAWDVWNQGNRFRIADECANWPAHAWEVLASFCEALADDAAEEANFLLTEARQEGEETALDAWVRSVETEHEWRKVDGDG